MSTEKLIHDAADQCDWDPDMVVSVLADFIDEFCDPDDFKAFLEARNFDGFAVYEQDMYPCPPDKPFPIARHNRQVLRDLGL